MNKTQNNRINSSWSFVEASNRDTSRLEPRFAPSWLRRRFLRLHRNNKGAIAVLTLLTIWCLVALIGMLWNTTEEATRRQHLQTAADSAAHSAALWSTRVTNAVAAQNMVIAQDAAAQTIWTAVPIADASIKKELNAELALAQRMLQGNGLQNLRNQLLRQVGDATNEHDLAEQALANVSADLGEANFPDARAPPIFPRVCVRPSPPSTGSIKPT